MSYINKEKLLQRIEASPLFNNFGEDGFFIKNFVIELIREYPQTDVAREIFEEIEKYMLTDAIDARFPVKVINPDTFAKLKKKYTEGGK